MTSYPLNLVASVNTYILNILALSRSFPCLPPMGSHTVARTFVTRVLRDQNLSCLPKSAEGPLFLSDSPTG